MPLRLFSTTKGLIYTPGETETPTYHLTVTDQLITFKITVEYVLNEQTHNVTIHDWKLPLEAVTSTHRIKSNTLIGIIAPSRGFNKEFLTPTQVINLSEAALSQRIKFTTTPKLGSNPSELQIFIRNPNLGFTHQDIILCGESNVIIDSTETFEHYQDEGTNNTAAHIDLVDAINVSKDTTYTNADYIKYNVSSESYVDEIYLEPINGICDKTRVVLTAGSGSFRVLKSSIESGNKVRVKLGFVSYSGITELNETL
jgi:hypothetical protein